jgi:hypothetical protein
MCPSFDRFSAQNPRCVAIVGNYFAQSGVTGTKTHLPPHNKYTTWWTVIIGMDYYVLN